MPIVMQTWKGTTGPMYLCDVCGERIEDAGMAWLMWDNTTADADGRVPAFVVAHKRTCVPIVEKEHPTFTSTTEMRTIIYQLAANVGMSIEDLKRQEETSQMLRGL